MTFLDTGGHEKYTTKIVSGLCSFYPDYTLIVISAAEGVTSIAEKHLKLACFFGVPFIIAVTHIDLVDSSDLFDLRSNVRVFEYNLISNFVRLKEPFENIAKTNS